MPEFNKKSRAKLFECDEKLIQLFDEVIKIVDCKVICGYRGEIEQNCAYDEKKSEVRFPNSKHNVYPTQAVDVIPYPIDWLDIERFVYFAGIVRGVASQLNINIKWGGWWKMRDMPHYELT
ncbi:MAG: hypothetical protein K8R79_02025 [Calditrichales bacterium]|nr:hypothetical protein [Calditrichales bacterium]